MNKGRPKVITIMMLLLVIVLVLAVLLIINYKTAPQSSHKTDGRRKLAVTGEVSAISSSNSMVYCLEDLLIEAQEGNLRVKNIKGNVAWSQKLPANITDICGAGGNLLITDSENNLHYYNLQGKLLWSHKANNEIVDLFTEDNGSFLAEYRGMTGSHGDVFTQNGSKAGSFLVEKAHILAFSAGDNVFSISALDTSVETIKTRIITYDLKGDILWAQNFDNRIITKLSYDKNMLIALSEDSLYAFTGDGTLHKEARIEGEIDKAILGSNLIVLSLQDKGKKYLVCYDTNLSMKSKMEIERIPMGIYPMKSSFIAYYTDELLVIDTKAELVARFKSNSEINRVYGHGENKLFIVSNRKLQLLEYVK